VWLSNEVKDFYWPQTIERIVSPSPLTFYRDYVSKNKPVILTEMIDGWKALKKWNHKYLKSKYGEELVSVDITPNGLGDSIVKNGNDDVFVQPYQVQMKLGEFIDIMNKEKEGIGTYYIQKQNDNFRKEFMVFLWVFTLSL